MPRHESWTTLQPEFFGLIRDSSCTDELQRDEWPPWARTAPQVERMFVYALALDETVPSVRTTGTIVARLLSERYDRKDQKPYNYNWYAVVESVNGTLYQSGAHRDIDFGHHLSQPVSNISLGMSR